jgi:large subunit ribosomal protein L4
MAEKKAKATKRPKAGGPGGAPRNPEKRKKADHASSKGATSSAAPEKQSAEKPSAEKPSARLTSPKVAVVNAANETIREIQLSPTVFAAKPGAHLVYEAVKQHRAGARRGTHATKNRALVSGSGKKPWRQKGTGRARVGEIRTPLWRHGGTVFGPQPRDYSFAMPRKARAAALRAALSQRLHEGAVKVVEGFEVPQPKTKLLKGLLATLGISGKAVVVDHQPTEFLVLSGRNLEGEKVVADSHLTAYDVMDCKHLVLSQEAVDRLEERLTPQLRG